MSEACGVRGMLKEKRREVGNKAGKLKGGLQKLQETGEQVADMQVSHLSHLLLSCCMCSGFDHCQLAFICMRTQPRVPAAQAMWTAQKSTVECCVQIVCQDKKVVVAEAKTSCEQLLVAIVQDKRVADEQEKQVSLTMPTLCPWTV